jgi:hypothetical protein
MVYRLVRGYSAKLGFEIGAHALRATAATNALDHQADIAKGDPGQDQAGAGAQAVASATEAICAPAGDHEAETGREALSCPDERRQPNHRHWPRLRLAGK